MPPSNKQQSKGMGPRKALGKGLEALLGSVDSAIGTLRDISLGEVVPNPYQPRVVFETSELEALSESIKRQGVLQPITVRKRPQGDYELISGERRWRASKLAGRETIPALVRQAGKAESLELALVENIQRKNLTPIEAAQAYQRMITEFHLTQEQVAARVGKERSSVANVVRLINLPREVQESIQTEHLSLGHAKVLLSLAKRPDLQVNLARRCVSEGLSVRQLEAAINHQQGSAPKPSPKSLETRTIETRLYDRLRTRVTLSEGKRSGRIEIRYKGEQERDRLIHLLMGTD